MVWWLCKWFLETEDLDFTGYYSEIYINDSGLNFVVVEVPGKYLDKLYVEAYDSNTGVNIKTDSYDVFVDVRVKAKDVKDDKKIKDRFAKNNLIIESAYDLSLTKSFGGTFINVIDKGIEGYFPVSESYKTGSKHKIYYVSDNSYKEEEFEGVVVEVEGKNYVKFITNHFSTYVLASSEVDNPQTSDGITNNIILGIISLFGLLGSIILLKNSKTRINYKES